MRERKRERERLACSEAVGLMPIFLDKGCPYPLLEKPLSAVSRDCCRVSYLVKDLSPTHIASISTPTLPKAQGTSQKIHRENEQARLQAEMLPLLPSGHRAAVMNTVTVNLLMVKPADTPARVGGGIPKALPLAEEL